MKVPVLYRAYCPENKWMAQVCKNQSYPRFFSSLVEGLKNCKQQICHERTRHVGANVNNSRNQNLDVLRGIAILLVLGSHYEYFFVWARIGWFGVDLFF